MKPRLVRHFMPLTFMLLLRGALVFAADDRQEDAQAGPVRMDLSLDTVGVKLPEIKGFKPTKPMEAISERGPGGISIQTSNMEGRPQWEARAGKNAWRRTRALAAEFVMAMDEEIAFTAGQREKLLPLAERVCRDERLFRNRSNFAGVNSRQRFHLAGAQVEEEELAEILDPAQTKRWRELSETARASVIRMRTRTPPPPPAENDAAPAGPEEMEAAISDRLYKAGRGERKNALAVAMLRAEDIIRTAGVDDRAAEHLRTAARGAAEAQMEGWRNTTGGSIQAQLRGAAGADFAERLRNVTNGLPQSDRTLLADANAGAIWDRMALEELTKPQREAWQAGLDARADFRTRALAGVALAEFDRVFKLTPDQWESLEPLLIEQVEEYGPDIDITMNQWNDAEWFYSSNSALLPVMGVSGKTMRKILKDEQWESWTASPLFEFGEGSWRDIELTHKRRIKHR